MSDQQSTSNADPTVPTGEASVGTTDMGTQNSAAAPNSAPNAGGGTDTGITGDDTAGGGLTGGDQADAGHLSAGTRPIPSGQ
jgi:hypothetical protein